MRLKRISLIAILALVPAAALADCESMWLTRNMVFDRAGYCFGSNLGQAIFGNRGCTGTDVKLTARERDFVAHTREMERIFGCRIDTSRRGLSLDLMDLWLRLEDLPRRDEFESGCIGWQGKPVPLYAGTSAATAVLSTVRKDESVLFSHWQIGDWYFVTTALEGVPTGLGWTRQEFFEGSCDFYAG